jgi:hypothetical protein
MSQYTHKFRSQESHLDPPDEPDVEADDEYLSTCCTANSTTETFDGIGMCSYCGEHAEFVNEKGEIEK